MSEFNVDQITDGNSDNDIHIPSFISTDSIINEVEHDGALEVSSLTDIDDTFTNKIGAVLERLHISNPDHPENAQLVAFANRPVSEKITMGEFDTPIGFLKTLSKQGKENLSLPCIYVTRNPSISFVKPDQYSDVTGSAELRTSDDAYLGAIDQTVTVLNYQINIVGWKNDNIEAIALLILSWLRLYRNDHSFTAKTQLGGASYELRAEITDQHLAAAVSANLPFEEDKLRVLAINVTVNAEVATVCYGREIKSHIHGGSYIV